MGLEHQQAGEAARPVDVGEAGFRGNERRHGRVESRVKETGQYTAAGRVSAFLRVSCRWLRVCPDDAGLYRLIPAFGAERQGFRRFRLSSFLPHTTLCGHVLIEEGGSRIR